MSSSPNFQSTEFHSQLNTKVGVGLPVMSTSRLFVFLEILALSFSVEPRIYRALLSGAREKFYSVFSPLFPVNELLITRPTANCLFTPRQYFLTGKKHLVDGVQT